MIRTYTPEEVAEQVSEDNNNPSMKGWLRLYLEAIERSGFKIIKGADNA